MPWAATYLRGGAVLPTASLCALLLILMGPVPRAAQPAAERRGGPVLISGMRGPITPVTVEYVRKTLAKADEERCELVLFEMDTPGGLVTSSEEIIQEILSSRTPVAVYVSPAGAQAASAGLYIANAADIIAMTPGTRIGAGHPVGPMGGNPGEGEKGSRNYLGEKIENDMAAGVRSIATNRGRNAEVYERMVRESIALTEREALDQKVIDYIVNDVADLLERLDGREISRFDGRKQTLALKGAPIHRFEMTLRQKILSWIANPNIAFLLLGVGVLGLYVEFNHPGLILPGVIGGVALILFAMSVQILPINLLGLLLVILAVALFILEIKFTSYGLLTAGGILAMTLGFLTLFDTREMPDLGVSLSFILPTALTIGGVMAAVTLLVVRAQRTRVATGVEALAGEIGEAMTDLEPEGKVFVHGEYWNAMSSEPIARGRKVRVKAVRNLSLDVEPVDR
jgi:membrane-bound serine protease (ClpP class)